MRIRTLPNNGTDRAGGATIQVLDDVGNTFVVDVTVSTQGRVYIDMRTNGRTVRHTDDSLHGFNAVGGYEGFNTVVE